MPTITLTFGDVCENGPGMQKRGILRKEGLSDELLRQIAKRYNAEYYNLGDREASILILRNGLETIFAQRACDFITEQNTLLPDKKALIRGRVVNKHARHNLCFDEDAQEADYAAGKGTVISFEQVPHLTTLKSKLEKVFECQPNSLKCEGNYYYDTQKCYIGFHGDAERKVVIGLRLQDAMPLVFQWYERFKAIGDQSEFILNSGDIYAMSFKATGHDWKRSSIKTLRHAAGWKFIKVKSTLSSTLPTKDYDLIKDNDDLIKDNEN